MARHAEVALGLPATAAENPAREILAILARGKWTVLIVFLVVTGLVVWGTLQEKPLYEAESSLMVRIGREYVYRPEVGRTETARTPSLTEMVNSEVEILSSRDLAELVVNDIGVERLYPDLLAVPEPDEHLAAEIAVLRFRKAASIRPVLESSVIKVGFEHEVPQLAADAVNFLVERFKDKHVEVFGEERASRLEAQLEPRLAHLADAERTLADFKRQNGVFDLDAQRNLLLDRRERLDQAVQSTDAELAALRLRAGPDSQAEPPTVPELPPYLRPEMKEQLMRQRADLELALRGFEPPVSDRLAEQASLRLLELELEEGRLLRDYSPSSRKVKGVQEEILRVRTFLQQAETRAGAYDEARREERQARSQDLTAEIARLTSEIELLVREEERQLRIEARRSIQILELQRADHVTRLAAVELEIRNLDQHEQPLRRLARELVAAESAANTYRERVDEARITDELDREKRINVRVIEKASAPVAPTGLPRNLKLAIGAVVGLVAGVGLAVLFDLFRSR